MFDHLFRQLKERWFEPLALRIGRRVSPNALSLAACLLGLCAAWAAARGHHDIALLGWLANRMLDGFDGTLARVTSQQSDFGGYLDIVCDFIVYAAMPIGVVIGSGAPGAEVALVWLLAAFFVNAASWMYLSAVLEKRAVGAHVRGELTTVTMPPALIAGTETVIFFSLFLIFPSKVPTLMWAMTVLLGIGILGRLVWARRSLA
jgi:phosphatidylglycerophosphate synthase